LTRFLLVGIACTLMSGQNAEPAGSGNRLYAQLGNVGLDISRVYRAREISIDRGFFHITLDDGTIGFTSDVAGRCTGAFFEGDGEVLLTPPNEAERGSMALFTGGAILEERFSTAYLRFNDDTFQQLQGSLRSYDGGSDFVAKWNQTVVNLAPQDALRLLVTASQQLPSASSAVKPPSVDDRFLHVRMQGSTKGTFDVYFDSKAPEQVWAGQLNNVLDGTFYDVWTAASPLKRIRSAGSGDSIGAEEGPTNAIEISDFKIQATIHPPTSIDAETTMQLLVRRGGQRTLLFELARTLVIKAVEADGNPVEFIHNPTLEGTQLARRGNDLVAVVLPEPTKAGQKIQLRFVYAGEVLSEAGPGLLYVGARGTWYPNRGLAMSNFDLEFRYPGGWTLVATGKRVDTGGVGTSPTEQFSHWISERPIPLAGFNLGKYQHAEVTAGSVRVNAYGTNAVERSFPHPEEQVFPEPVLPGTPPPVITIPSEPSPARNVQAVAATSASAVEAYSRFFGPYPYSQLSLTQMPGNLSQGWPGLIFLSSYSFLSPEERSALQLSDLSKSLINLVIAHETAHQWWGDLVLWNNYRDQWISEALANYSALMLEEGHDPIQFRAVLETYRDNLLKKDKDGTPLLADGPVTLGSRLSCSKFPNGYVAISYGRGTWLMHMLRYMLRDAEPGRSVGTTAASSEEPFLRGLRRVRERYAGKPITTREFLQVFEEDLPRSLWYEGHKSLDWFYHGWVNGTSVPHFELHNLKYADSASGTVVTGTLLQKECPPELVSPVPIYASHAGKLVFLGRVMADGPETPFRMHAPANTRKVVVDPSHTVLSRN